MGEVIRFSRSGIEGVREARTSRSRATVTLSNPIDESEVVRIVTASVDRLPRATRDGAETTLDVAETAARTARALGQPRVCQLWDALARAARDRLAQLDQGQAVAASARRPAAVIRPLSQRVQDARDALRPPAKNPAVQAHARRVRAEMDAARRGG